MWTRTKPYLDSYQVFNQRRTCLSMFLVLLYSFYRFRCSFLINTCVFRWFVVLNLIQIMQAFAFFRLFQSLLLCSPVHELLSHVEVQWDCATVYHHVVDAGVSHCAHAWFGFRFFWFYFPFYEYPATQSCPALSMANSTFEREWFPANRLLVRYLNFNYWFVLTSITGSDVVSNWGSGSATSTSLVWTNMISEIRSGSKVKHHSLYNIIIQFGIRAIFKDLVSQKVGQQSPKVWRTGCGLIVRGA